MAATVGSTGFHKAIAAYKNEGLPHLQNMVSADPQQQQADPSKQQYVLKRVTQGHANLQSAEFGHLTRSESGVTISQQQFNRSDIASGKSAFRTPDKLTQGKLGNKLIEKHPTQLYPPPNIDLSKGNIHGNSFTQSTPTPYSPMTKDNFDVKLHKMHHRMDSDMTPNATHNIFMTHQRPLGKAVHQSPSRQQVTRNSFLNNQSRQHQQQLNTFFVKSKKLDVDYSVNQTFTQNQSCMSNLENSKLADIIQGTKSQKGRRVQSVVYDQSEKDQDKLFKGDTKQYLMKLAQPSQNYNISNNDSPIKRRQFPQIVPSQSPDTSQTQLVAKSIAEAKNKYSVHQKNRKMTIRSPDTMHAALRKHHQEHSVLALPISAQNSQPLVDCYDNEVRQSRYDALQVIQNLIFETSCNPNQMHSTKAKQQAQIYQFLAAKESFFNTSSKPQTSYTPNESPQKLVGISPTKQTKEDINMKMIPIDLPKQTPNYVEMMNPRRATFQGISKTPKPKMGSNVSLNQYMK